MAGNEGFNVGVLVAVQELTNPEWARRGGA